MSAFYVTLVLLLSTLSAFAIPQIQVNLNSRTGEGSSIQELKDSYECLDGDGDFEDQFQCDKYWTCKHGIAAPKLCADGLVFNTLKADGRPDPCDSIHVVDCTTKPILQPATHPNALCPRSNGLFAPTDTTICDVYYQCVQKKPVKKVCAPGLHFSLEKSICDWPIAADRQGCAPEKLESIDGFTCPNEKVVNEHGQPIPNPNYPHLEDCQKFYNCISGKTPRAGLCDPGQVFNEVNGMCDEPANVPECAHWFLDAGGAVDADYVYEDEIGASRVKRSVTV